MSNKGWEDAVGKTWDRFFEEAQNTWKTVYDLNHGFIDPDAKERAENEARFEALEARVEALENKTTTDTGEFIDTPEGPPADVEFRWETSWHFNGESPIYPDTWTFREGKLYDQHDRVIDQSFLKEYGFVERGRWVSEWRDL